MIVRTRTTSARSCVSNELHSVLLSCNELLYLGQDMIKDIFFFFVTCTGLWIYWEMLDCCVTKGPHAKAHWKLLAWSFHPDGSVPSQSAVFSIFNPRYQANPLCDAGGWSLFVSCYGHADWMQSGNGASVRKKLITLWERPRKAGATLNAVGAYWKRCQCVNRELGQGGTGGKIHGAFADGSLLTQRGSPDYRSHPVLGKMTKCEKQNKMIPFPSFDQSLAKVSFVSMLTRKIRTFAEMSNTGLFFCPYLEHKWLFQFSPFNLYSQQSLHATWAENREVNHRRFWLQPFFIIIFVFLLHELGRIRRGQDNLAIFFFLCSVFTEL